MEIREGLILTAAGMGLVFASLSLLLLMMKGLDRLFPFREEGGEKVSEPGEAGVEEDQEVAAAISVAVATLMLDGERRPRPPLPPGGQPSGWRTFGRQQLMNSRGRRTFR